MRPGDFAPGSGSQRRVSFESPLLWPDDNCFGTLYSSS